MSQNKLKNKLVLKDELEDLRERLNNEVVKISTLLININIRIYY